MRVRAGAVAPVDPNRAVRCVAMILAGTLVVHRSGSERTRTKNCHHHQQQRQRKITRIIVSLSASV
eukprot:scaffold2655_cov179-Amphora_coffeaeformis.AAC.20